MASSWTWTEPGAIPAGRRASGRLAVPPSKSATHRAYNLALLAGGDTLVERPLDAEDTRLFLDALQTCGLTRRAPAGRGAPAAAGTRAGGAIFCGNAGTMLRFLTAALATIPGRWRLDGVARLRERPVGPLVEALRQLGAQIDVPGPLRIPAARRRGRHPARRARAARRRRVQPVPVGAPHGGAAGGVAGRDRGRGPRLGALRRAHASARSPTSAAASSGATASASRSPRRALAAERVTVEGDYSAACYPAAAAALTGGRVALAGLAPDSAQGDRGFLDLLATMGAEVERRPESIEIAGGGALRARRRRPRRRCPIRCRRSPPSRPSRQGTTRIRNVRHLRIKESDRLAAMARACGAWGRRSKSSPTDWSFPGSGRGGSRPSEPVEVDPRGDHRIAMSLALVGLRRPGVRVRTPEVVAKSYPGFWRDLDQLLARSSERRHERGRRRSAAASGARGGARLDARRGAPLGSRAAGGGAPGRRAARPPRARRLAAGGRLARGAGRAPRACCAECARRRRGGALPGRRRRPR